MAILLRVITILLLLACTQVHSKGVKKLHKSIFVDQFTIGIESDNYEYGNTRYLTPTISYQTSSGWNIGILTQNVLIDGTGGAQNLENDTYLNLAKSFEYTKQLHNISHWSSMVSSASITFGMQQGLVLPLSSSVNPNKINSNTLHQFYVIDNRFDILCNVVSIHGGPYYTNAALSISTNYVGWLLGTEVTIIPKSLRLVADVYSGHSNVSGSIFQLVHMMNNNLEVYAGWSVPATNSGNYNYLMVGINVIKLFN
jgi:hypothetical protein